MPYSWESETWYQRLKGYDIVRPPASGLNITNILLKEDKKYLFQLFTDACYAERNRKLCQVNDMLKTIDCMIQRKKSYPSWKDRTVGAGTILDLQGLWYILAGIIGKDFIREGISVDAESKFMKEYLRVLLPWLKRHLAQGFTLVSSKSLLEGLVLHHGIGPVNISEFQFTETRSLAYSDFQCELEKYLDEFLAKASFKMKRHKFSFKKVGSTGEGCKIGYADEYDYRLEFEDCQIAKAMNDPHKPASLLEIKAQFASSRYDIHEEFIETVKSLRNKEGTERLSLLACDDWGVPVPWLLFSWQTGENKCMLIKVDCALTVPCRDLWPSNRIVDPLNQPITKLVHLMLPNPNALNYSKWKWSVCNAQQEFFHSLPKYVRLGYMITKILCSPTLFPEYRDVTPPTTFRLKNCLFNALANKDLIVTSDDWANEKELYSRALQVADVIVAGLDKALFGYFHDGEPTEYVKLYIERDLAHNNFLPQHMLYMLAEDYINHNFSSKSSKLQSLIPATYKLVRGKEKGDDLKTMRGILGLLTPERKDTWELVAKDAASKWTHRLPEAVTCMLFSAALRDTDLDDRCMEDLELVRTKVAQFDLACLYKFGKYDNEYADLEVMIVGDVMKFSLHHPQKPPGKDFIMCGCGQTKQPVYSSIGEVLEQCMCGLKQMIDDISQALVKDGKADPKKSMKKLDGNLLEVRKKYCRTYRTDNNLRRVILKGHVIDLTKEKFKHWRKVAVEMVKYQENFWEVSLQH